MDIDELKKLLKNSTAVLVLDNGEPSYVILDYNSYKALILKEKEVKINNIEKPASGNGKERGEEREILERINKDILAIKNEIENEEKAIGANTEN
ncbi:MAG: hypothetical protein A2746_00260 [Candidatus Yanofskybacteria bacterium RIFCSPHIGHO2_01_FULL_44_22]|uniref:Antitoxin n=1 Tax=Candidatus Yanofskybacteria bacterium RIFCSPHIGHO2_01_FULL_44_22 TaxID=1802669 RepID=A0A1F8ESX3_9BACT|nr:MAG: hypothetical protein A2746_00260 [Candidatus Yanofskybacteria bacterium RIFCSPHIGHO2_01_FULL_44_22]